MIDSTAIQRHALDRANLAEATARFIAAGGEIYEAKTTEHKPDKPALFCNKTQQINLKRKCK